MVANAWGNLTSRAACLGVGVWLAVTLTDGLKPAIDWVQPVKPRPVRVAVRAAVQPAPVAAAVAPRQVLPLKVEHAPAKPKTPKPKAAPTTAVAAAAPAEATPVPVPPVAPMPLAPQPPLPTLEQPAIMVPPKLAQMQLPAVPASDVPPAPPDETAKTYPEQPGGSVLVLELTVNDQGYVIDSRIAVPSSNALGDVSLALASKGQRWTGLVPPLQPGEQRRLEIRLPYDQGKAKADADLLP